MKIILIRFGMLLVVLAGGCASFFPERSSKIMGDDYYARGDYDKALESYKNAMAQGSNNRNVQRNIAIIYNIKKQYDLSIPIFYGLLQKDPKDFDSRIGLGNAYVSSDISRALQEYSEILKFDADHVLVHERLGWAHYSAKNYGAARRHFLKVLNHFHRNHSVLTGMGSVAMAEKKWEEAYRFFSDLRDNYPQDPTALAALKTISTYYKP
ncbi:MAG: tetratricopeptide repeat protein [Deltaproteobacteria bacterium]|nr:tetratricopeptide repeat protein [Deltaproteobacteria bacterium]